MTLPLTACTKFKHCMEEEGEKGTAAQSKGGQNIKKNYVITNTKWFGAY